MSDVARIIGEASAGPIQRHSFAEPSQQQVVVRNPGKRPASPLLDNRLDKHRRLDAPPIPAPPSQPTSGSTFNRDTHNVENTT
jgi:hypothetical protein